MIRQIDPGQYRIELLNRNVLISERLIILIIIVFALVLRLVSALYQGNTVSDLPGIYDQISYDGLARRVVGGYGFTFAEDHWPATLAGEPTAHWSFLYTLFLAGIYRVFGIFPLAARLVQVLIASIFQVWFTFRIGKRIFGSTVGLISAFICAVYIYFFYYAGGLVTETFFIIGILWTIDTAFIIFSKYQTQNSNSGFKRIWIVWLVFGIAITVTTLLRQTFLLFLPFLFLWLWWNLPGYKEIKLQKKLTIRLANWSVIRGILISVFVLVLMIIPWTIRNYQAFDTFVLLNTNAGFAFFWGNHPVHGTKFIPLLSATGQSYQDLIPPELITLNEGKLDRALLQEGFRFVSENPFRYINLSLSRFEEFFKFWPSRNSSLISNISRIFSFGLLLPFIILGLWKSVLLIRKPVIQPYKEYIYLLYLFMTVYTCIHLLSWTLIRYRIPVDAILIIFAALGLNLLYKAIRKKQNSVSYS